LRRYDSIDQHVHSAAPGPIVRGARTESARPSWASWAAAHLAAFLAIYRFDFDQAHAWHDWASPYQQQLSGTVSLMYSYCLSGLTAREQLDVAEAGRRFRKALGIEGGPVEFIMATYATGPGSRRCAATSLLRDGTPTQIAAACMRAANLRNSIDAIRRPRAALYALVPVVAKCADIGLIRPLRDGGPWITSLVRALDHDLREGHWRDGWPRVSWAFLTVVLLD
jgi:hypothetical protein